MESCTRASGTYWTNANSSSVPKSQPSEYGCPDAYSSRDLTYHRRPMLFHSLSDISHQGLCTLPLSAFNSHGHEEAQSNIDIRPLSLPNTKQTGNCSPQNCATPPYYRMGCCRCCSRVWALLLAGMPAGVQAGQSKIAQRPVWSDLSVLYRCIHGRAQMA